MNAEIGRCEIGRDGLVDMPPAPITAEGCKGVLSQLLCASHDVEQTHVIFALQSSRQSFCLRYQRDTALSIYKRTNWVEAATQL